MLEVGFWIATALSLAANALAIVLLVQLLRKADRTAIYKWSRRLGFFVIALAAIWAGMTALGVGHAFAGVRGADPSQKATLLAAGISEAMNCTAALLVFLLFPTVVVIVARIRSSPKRRASAP
jgi:hypothetical protein